MPQSRRRLAIGLASLVIVLGAWALLASGPRSAPEPGVQAHRSAPPGEREPDPAAMLAPEEAPSASPRAREVVRDDPDPSPPIEAVAAEPPTDGAVFGRVHDDTTAGISARVLLMQSSRQRSAKRTATDGAFRFDAVAPGRYRLEIDPESLPETHIPPFSQSAEIHYADSLPPGFYAKVVEVSAGEEVEADLFAHRAASFSGIVVEPDGTPVSGALVHLQCQSIAGLQGLASIQYTDDRGQFALDDVYPATYYLYAVLPQDYAGPSAPPYPDLTPFSVEPGGRYYQRIELVRTNTVARGRVVDENGAPVADLPVIAYYYDPAPVAGAAIIGLTDQVDSIRTGSDGAFELHLTQEPIAIAPGAYQSLGKPGERRMARPVQPARLNLRGHGPGVIELGDLAVELCHPFRMRSPIVLTEGAGGAIDLDDLKVEVRFDDPKTGAPVRQSVDVGDDGALAWACETPHPPVTIVLRHGRREERVTREVVVDAIPDATYTDPLRFP